LSYWEGRLKAPLKLLAPRIADVHPRVRLEAIRAVAQITNLQAAELVLSSLNKPMDPFLDYAAWLSINELAQPWAAAVKSGKWKPDGREDQLTFALKALEPAVAGPVLSYVMESRKIASDGTGPWIELIGAAGDPVLLQRLFDQTLHGGFNTSASVHSLKALGDAARKREIKPSRNLKEIGSLLKSPDQEVSEQAVRLIGAWKLQDFVQPLISLAAENSTSSGIRQAAFDALREIGGRQVVNGLLPLTGKAIDQSLRQQAILALAAINLDKAGQPAVDLLLETRTEKDAGDLWRSLLTIKGAAPKLAKLLPKTGLPPVMAKAGLRAAREGGRNEPDLVWALTRGADLEADSQTLTEEEIKQLAASVASDGDPARGEKIFRRKELNCFTCHAIGGVGGKVGPDLTSIGASAQVDYLVESVLYPNRKIKEGYHSVIVETKDGLEFSGVLVSENSDQLILRDATDKETTISKANIQNRSTGNSLMPSGLVDQLSPTERLDLYRFLSELGKPGHYDASKGNVARSWKLFAQTLELSQFGDEKVLQTEFSDTKWKAARTIVDGGLLKEDVATVLDGIGYREPQAVYAAARFEVSKAGSLSLELTGADGSPAWIDGKPAGACGNLKPELTAGPHAIIVKLDAKKLPDVIRLQSPDATFLVTWQ
jgi:putative heme-binding domain-containing protein